jgi:hypothetical protein
MHLSPNFVFGSHSRRTTPCLHSFLPPPVSDLIRAVACFFTRASCLPPPHRHRPIRAVFFHSISSPRSFDRTISPPTLSTRSHPIPLIFFFSSSFLPTASPFLLHLFASHQSSSPSPSSLPPVPAHPLTNPPLQPPPAHKQTPPPSPRPRSVSERRRSRRRLAYAHYATLPYITTLRCPFPSPTALVAW